MHEFTKKRKYNTNVIAMLILKTGFSESYIRKIINGDRKGANAEIIKAEYLRIDSELNAVYTRNLKRKGNEIH